MNFYTIVFNQIFFCTLMMNVEDCTSHFHYEYETTEVPIKGHVVKHIVTEENKAIKLKCNILKNSLKKNKKMGINELRWEYKKCGYGLDLTICADFRNITWNSVMCKNGSKFCDGFTLNLENPSSSDSGYYRCLYKNYMSRNYKVYKMFQLDVYDPEESVEILIEPIDYDNQVVDENETARFRCRARSLSPLHMMWAKSVPYESKENGFLAIGDFHYELIHYGAYNIGNNLYISKMILPHCQISDSGYYYCIIVNVNNAHFTKNKTVSLTVLSKVRNGGMFSEVYSCEFKLFHENLLNGEIYQNLKTLIETLTHSGLRKLDENLFRELKRICKLSPVFVEKAYSLTFYQLKKKHSEIRLLAFQICVELFKRSALFRELIIRDLKFIFELTAETNPRKKLPPPKIIAENLITLALSTIQNWTNEFGKTYKELQIAFHYLKHVKQVNFQSMKVINEIDLQRQKHLETQKEEKMKKVLEEINSNKFDIENSIIALNNCLSLLVPSPDNFFINVDNDIELSEQILKVTNLDSKLMNIENSKDQKMEINLKHFGITHNYNISIDSNVVHNKIFIKNTEENSSLIQNAKDNVKLMKNRFLPLVKKWSQACIKYSADSGSTLQKIITLKEKMETSIVKYEELFFSNHSESESDIDNEFEEVTKEHFENFAPLIDDKDIGFSACALKKSLKSDWEISVGEEGDPTSARSTLKRLEKRNGILNRKVNALSDAALSAGNQTEVRLDKTNLDETDRKHRLLASAPTLPFDIDLYHWEDQNLTPPTLLSKQMELHEIPNPEGMAALRTRVIEFSGKFEPVKWSCRAALRSGKLCPRKDRFKCPFHGRIVARDENGVCQEKNKIALSTSVSNLGKFDFSSEDQEFLEDIKHATGEDLTMPRKKESKNKIIINKTYKRMGTSSSTLKTIELRKFPGLSDIIGKQNNAYKRISKKIFKRSSLNKVASMLDKIDYTKHRDKFGDQFNYVHET